jgi:hypothetical protein
MNKRDFELIASVLAAREAEIETLNIPKAERLGCRFAHRTTALAIEKTLEQNFKRFDSEKFARASLPLFYAMLDDSWPPMGHSDI